MGKRFEHPGIFDGCTFAELASACADCEDLSSYRPFALIAAPYVRNARIKRIRRIEIVRETIK